MGQEGVLIVLSGPSGTGKGTVCKALLQRCPELYYSISATTRPPRPGEVDGVNYFFVAQAQFAAMINNNELLEWAEVYQNFYGTPRKAVEEKLAQGRDVVLEIDTQGALQVKQRFPQGVFVYLLPPSMQELARRIKQRGTDSEEAIRTRLESAEVELACINNYEYVVVNDEIGRAVDKIVAIITAEKCRVIRNRTLVDRLYQDCGRN